MPTFTTMLMATGTNVGIEVPEEVMTALGGGRRVPVMVTLNGHVYPSTTAVMAGRVLVPVSKAVRDASGVAGGEEHEVTLERDVASRVPDVPDDLAEALAGAGVRAAYDALAPSRAKEHVRQVTTAKAPETRARRVQKVVDSLR